MDGSKETCTISISGNIILTLKTLAFLKIPLKNCGYCVDSGCILILESERLAKQFIETVAGTGDVVIIDNLQNVNVENYKLAFHLYSKKENGKSVESFLNRTDFLPVVVVAGIVPKEFHEKYYIFKANVPNVQKSRKAYESFKEFVLSDVKYVIRELRLLETAGFLQNSVVSSEFVMMYDSMIAVGWIWKLFMRNNGVKQIIADARFLNYLNDVQKWIGNIERFEGTYGISEAMKSVLINYAVEKNLQFHEGMVIDSDMAENINETIFYDSENYYFPEVLLKKICTPLVDTISFLQLKQEMFEEGMLMCNDNDKRNYTIKKELYFTDTSTKIRTRFLKISRESLLSDEGLEPLDYVLISQEKFANEYDLSEREVVEP